MASEEAIKDLFFDFNRQSLFEVTGDRNRTLNKRNQLHRLVYIARLRDDNFDRAEVADYYEKHIKKLQEDFQSEQITGLMLTYLKYIVHAVESSSETILNMVKFVHQGVTSEHGYESLAKILILSHDIPSRIFQQWGSRIIDVEEHHTEPYDPPGSTEDVISDVLRQLHKMGNVMATKPKPSLRSVIDLMQKIPEHLPQQDLLWPEDTKLFPYY
ncbi:testis-expressed protein 47-like isoform X2 [Gigantopelta aegis]|uniref:testis-expressed protein 47-like isoform X2 n=1 Tax=Gigantopelta aegis TaxID=1735272 RepID=UPI001B889EE2|nr:testis-expressed protein 47-like isoform X2 [Gigantopelta aegis]